MSLIRDRAVGPADAAAVRHAARTGMDGDADDDDHDTVDSDGIVRQCMADLVV